jgi:hypothetical protein
MRSGEQGAILPVVAADAGVTTAVPLTPAQRASVYQSIVQSPLQPKPVVTERIAPGETMPSGGQPPDHSDAGEPVPELEIGGQVPPEVKLHALPPDAVAAVPEIGHYRYAFIGHRVLLVDPATRSVIAAINQ